MYTKGTTIRIVRDDASEQTHWMITGKGATSWITYKPEKGGEE